MLKNDRKWNHIKCLIKTIINRKKSKLLERNKANKLNTVISTVDINTTLSIITLKINGLNAMIKIQRLDEAKNKTQLYFLKKPSNFKYTDTCI